MQKAISLLAILLALCTTACNLIEEPCFRRYEFKLPFTTSQQDTIHIGDTLWVSADFSPNLVDQKTGETILAANVDFHTGLTPTRIDLTQAQYAEQYFDYVAVLGDLVPEIIGFGVRYQYTDNYRFLAAVIPNTTGAYAFHITS